MNKYILFCALSLLSLQAEETPIICREIVVLENEIDIPSADLQKQLTSFVGESIDTEMLTKLQAAIQGFYEEKGRSFVAVTLPEQEITLGRVAVNVVQSRIGKVEVTGNAHTSEKLLKKYLGVAEKDPVNTNKLRDGLDFMNRNPFRKADLIYSEGMQPYSTDVQLLVDDRRPIRVYAGANNEGVPTTGREQCFAGINIARMFSLDHFFSYQYTASDNFSSFQAHTAQYLAFLPWRNVLSIYGGYSSVHADLPFPEMKNHGYSYQASGRYVVPFSSSRLLTHEGAVGFDFKRTNNTILFSEVFPVVAKNVNLSQFALRYGGTLAGKTYEFGYEGELLFSPGAMMGDQTNDDYESLRPDAKNHWVYAKILAKYLQKLPGSFYLSCVGRGQLSSQNLLPSEQVGLGGFDSVRGYDERQLNYDSGFILNTELKSPSIPVISYWKKKKAWRDSLQFVAFLDYGYGGNHNLIPGEKIHDYLLGVGPAVRYVLDPWLTARLDFGVKLHKESTFTGGDAMWYFSTVGSF